MYIYFFLRCIVFGFMQKQSTQTYWWIWWHRFSFLFPQRPIPHTHIYIYIHKYLNKYAHELEAWKLLYYLLLMIGITVNCQTVNQFFSTRFFPLPWRFSGYLVGAGCESFGPRVQQQGEGISEGITQLHPRNQT